jgi:hypothetical protein
LVGSVPSPEDYRMWKILIGLDIAFSSLAIVAAGVLGNSLIANHIPRLHDNSTWLSRLVMTGLTAPDALADWALGALPTTSILLLFTVLFAAESLLTLLTPLVDRALAVEAAHKYQQDLRSTYHEVLRNREKVRSLKRRILRRVILRLSAISLLAFTVGLAAGAIAWGVALLINANTGGVIQTIAIVTSIIALLLMCDVLKEIVPTVVEDDNDGLARFGELPRGSALPLRQKVQRPWRVIALAVFIVGSIVVVSRLAQRQQETPVQEIEAPTSVAQSAPANSFLEPITDPGIAANLTRQIRKTSLDRDPIVVVSLEGDRAWINLKGVNVELPLVAVEGVSDNKNLGNRFSRRFEKDSVSLLVQYEVLSIFGIQEMGCTRTEYRVSIELSGSQAKEHVEPESYGEGC